MSKISSGRTSLVVWEALGRDVRGGPLYIENIEYISLYFIFSMKGNDRMMFKELYLFEYIEPMCIEAHLEAHV